MPKYHKEIKTIYQGKEMWVQVDPQNFKKLEKLEQLRTCCRRCEYHKMR